MNDSTREWILSRPPHVQAAIRRFPPLCKVRAVEGEKLLIPAPGVVGTVVSWFENGGIGVEAPMAETRTSPITGITIEAGEVLRAECRPDALELAEEGPIGRASVAELLD